MVVLQGGFAGWGYSYPTDAQQGDYYYRIDLAGWYYYNSGVWTAIPSAGGGDTITSPNSTLTVGGTSAATTLDIALANANTWTALQTFAAGKFAFGGYGHDVVTSKATGDIWYYNGTNLVNLAIGGTGNVLTVAGGVPTWAAAPSGAITSVSNSDGTLTISPTTGIVVASLALGHANTWSALQKFTNADLALLGSSTGYTLLESGLSSSSNNTLTLPVTASDTLAALGTVQSFSAAQTFAALTTTAGLASGVTAKSSGSPYSVLTTDEVLLITTGSSSDYTVTLPAANANAGRKLIVIKIDSGTNHVVIARAGSDSIEGATSKTITAQYGKIGLISDGTSVWYDLGTGGGI